MDCVAVFGLDVTASLADATGIVRYALVFLFAAIPIVEILVVIPVAIGVGLDPGPTGVVAFAGNAGSVVLLVAFHRRVSRLWARRRGDPADREPGRYARARRVWDRYGLPGLALAAPVLTGVHIAALLALAAGSTGRAVAAWMTAGIAAWTVVLVVASVFGLSLFGIV